MKASMGNRCGVGLVVLVSLLCLQSVTGWCASFPCIGTSGYGSTCRGNRLLNARTQRGQYDYSGDDYYEAADDYREDDRENYDTKSDWREESGKKAGKAGAYDVYFGGSSYDESEDEMKWELCDDSSTWVLHPPTYVDTPTSVIHFVGGTFFGSSPKLWYKTLLEEVVRATQCTVVATPIPVTLLQNPLRHVSLSRKLQRQFQSAYINVLSDEYDPDVLSQVPIVGMGHSLGARLLTVLATLSDKPSVMIPPYKSYILMSFNNFGSSASVPGIQTLLKQSKSLEYGAEDDRRRKRRRRDDYYVDYFDDNGDEDWDELFDDLQGALKEQADKVKNALTPSSEELEFHPTPDQLWEALKTDKRYRIKQTLVVHFKDDEVDQSPRLADCLLQTHTSDVKYAWLKGNHLTPISADGEQGWSQWLKFPAKASKALARIVRGDSRRGPSDTMRDLRQSIARYITDVVTK